MKEVRELKHRINIKGALIPSSYKWYYDWLKMETTCPRDVQKILDQVQAGDEIEVNINSPGGVVDVGSEIYTMLRAAAEKCNVKIYITGEADSAASIIAMASHCTMSPTALMMVHCVSVSGVSGNRSRMEHTAEMLSAADNALCTAYMEKTGMTREEALEMMEHETWMTAEQAKERGLVDAIMFESSKGNTELVAGPLFVLPSEEQLERVKALSSNECSNANKLDVELCQLELTGLINKKRR